MSQLPWFASLSWILAMFLLALVGFHIVLVRHWPLNSIQWKQVDYIWVSLAVLGVVASVQANREALARELALAADARMASSLEKLKADNALISQANACLEMHTPPLGHQSGAVTPPVDLCTWLNQVRLKLDAVDPKKYQKLTPALYSGLPPPHSTYWWRNDTLPSAASEYNYAVDAAELLRAETRPARLLQLLQFLGPALIALATALRLTKITGEISNERRRLQNGG